MGKWESRGNSGDGEGGKGSGLGSVDASGREGTGNHTHTQGFGISLILIRRTTRNPRQPESVGSEFTYGIVGRDVHGTDALAIELRADRTGILGVFRQVRGAASSVDVRNQALIECTHKHWFSLGTGWYSS